MKKEEKELLLINECLKIGIYYIIKNYLKENLINYTIVLNNGEIRNINNLSKKSLKKINEKP